MNNTNQLINKSTNQQVTKFEICLFGIGNWLITTERSLC